MADLPELGDGPYQAGDFENWRQVRSVTRPAFDAVYEHVREALAGAENILDIAGGDGHTLDVLGEAFAGRVTVLDTNGESLSRLKDKYPDARTVEADAGRMPFEDETFDAAISISAFESFAEADGVVPEIERVLKPGGEFTFFRDLPYSLKRLAYGMFRELEPRLRAQTYVVPFINRETKVLDQFALLPVTGVETLWRRGASTVLGQAALDNLVPYLRDNWIRDIYADRLEAGNLAQQFGVLVPEVEAAVTAEVRAETGLAGNAVVPLTEPLAPRFNGSLIRVFAGSALDLGMTGVETDYRTAEPVTKRGQPVRRLRIDELSNAHVYKFRTAEPPAGATTRVQGRTPVYAAVKS